MNNCLSGTMSLGANLLSIFVPSYFLTVTNMFLKKDKVCNTISAMEDRLLYFDNPSYISAHDTILASTFPMDYDFNGMKPWFACGMCVPPVMMANVAARIWDCWLSKIKKEECA